MAQNTPPPKKSFADTPGASIPALFSNRFYVSMNEQTTRIVFSEGLGGETINSHTAIVLPTSDAEQLGKLLIELVTKARNLEPPPADGGPSA